MLSCKQMTELITDFLEEQMEEPHRLEFQKHVALCRDCRAYLDQMRVTIKTLGKLPDEPIPEGVRHALLATFRELKT